MLSLRLILFLLGGFPGFQDPLASDAPKKSDEAPEQSADQPRPSIVFATGQVTDAIGAGQKDVVVTAFIRGPDGAAGKQIADAKTDAMGDFSLAAGEALKKGEIIVTFEKQQFTKLTRIIEIEEGKPAFLGEALEGDLKLRGRVLHAADQNPVAAHVVFENMFTRREIDTDADGSFEIGSLSPTQGTVEVTAAGFGRERRCVTVPSGQVLNIQMKPERSVHFTVTDRAGAPLPGALLECIDSARQDFRSLITGDDGTATLRGLHFDVEKIVVRLSKEGYVATSDVGETLTLPDAPAESRHTLVMERAGFIAGVIRDARTEAPLYGARAVAGDYYSDANPHEWTDTDGKYKLGGATPGLCTITVHLDGFAPELRTVEVVAGETSKLDFDLKPAAVVRGTVKTGEGKGAPGVEVAATKWRGKETLGLRAITDQDGNFVIENAPQDSFDLAIFAGQKPITKTVQASDAGIEFTVPKALGARTSLLSVGAAVPELTLRTQGGDSIELGKLKGKTVLVVFWATWCAPCVAEVPYLVAVGERFRGRNDFVMLGISRDFEESALTDFLKSQPKMTWPQVFGENAASAAEAFGVRGIPAIFLIDRDGKIVASDLRDDQILETIENTLGSKKDP